MARRPGKLTITLSGPYHFKYLERLLADLDPLARLTVRKELLLDLGGLTFVGPAGLAWLIAVVRRAEDLDLIAGGSVRMPRSPLTLRYLMRMDFLTTGIRRLDFVRVSGSQTTTAATASRRR